MTGSQIKFGMTVMSLFLSGVAFATGPNYNITSDTPLVTATDVIGVFDTCTGTQYLAADGDCYDTVSGLWTENAGDIYYDSGNVGIGTSTPEGLLDVRSGTSQILFNMGTGNNPSLIVGDSNDYTSSIKLLNGRIEFGRDGSAGGGYFFNNDANMKAQMASTFYIYDSSILGDAPATAFGESSQLVGGGGSVRGGLNQITRFQDTSNDTTFGREKIAHRIEAHDGGTGTKYLAKYFNDSTEQFSVQLDGTGYFAGNVGIGTETPTQQLELTESIAFPQTSASDIGVIYKGTKRFLHDYSHNGAETNTYLGTESGNFTNTAVENTGVGGSAFKSITSGSYNVAIGRGAASNLTTGQQNTFVGRQTGAAVITGSNNTLVGMGAGELWAGSSGTSIGSYAGRWNSGGAANTMLGSNTGYWGNSASYQTAVGYHALYSSINGNYNIGLGYSADLFRPTTAATATLTTGTNLGIGIYYYMMTFVLDTGETGALNIARKVTTSGNQAIDLSSLQTYTGPYTCTARKIYRTKVGAYGKGPYYLLATIGDNTTTTYSDTIADTSLTTEINDMNSIIVIGYGAKAYKSGQLILGSLQDEIYLGKGVTAASPGTISLLATNGNGTDNVGATLNIAAGAGTGSGVGGDITFQTSDVGTTGTGINTLSTKVTLKNDTGNLGIGTTTPQAKLTIIDGVEPASSGSLSKTLILSSDNYPQLQAASYVNKSSILAGNSTDFNFIFGGAIATAYIGAYLEDASYNTAIRFRTYNGSVTEKMRISSNGNVGIGDTAPESKLDINGDIHLTDMTAPGTTTNKLYSVAGVLKWNGQDVATGTVSSDSMIDADSDTQIQVEETGDEDKIRFDTGGIERMIIDEAGDVGIGTTTPGAKLTVDGDGLAADVPVVEFLSTDEDNAIEIGGASGTGKIYWDDAASELVIKVN